MARSGLSEGRSRKPETRVAKMSREIRRARLNPNGAKGI
jgi:hypothetical protein